MPEGNIFRLVCWKVQFFPSRAFLSVLKSAVFLLWHCFEKYTKINNSFVLPTYRRKNFIDRRSTHFVYFKYRRSRQQSFFLLLKGGQKLFAKKSISPLPTAFILGEFPFLPSPPPFPEAWPGLSRGSSGNGEQRVRERERKRARAIETYIFPRLDSQAQMNAHRRTEERRQTGRRLSNTFKS